MKAYLASLDSTDVLSPVPLSQENRQRLNSFSLGEVSGTTSISKWGEALKEHSNGKRTISQSPRSPAKRPPRSLRQGASGDRRPRCLRRGVEGYGLWKEAIKAGNIR